MHKMHHFDNVILLTVIVVRGHYAFLLLNGVHVIFMEDIDGAESLTWPDIALSPTYLTLLQMVSNHLLVVHL